MRRGGEGGDLTQEQANTYRLHCFNTTQQASVTQAVLALPYHVMPAVLNTEQESGKRL